MIVTNSNKLRKIIKVGISIIGPIVVLIYLLTTFMNLSLFSTELGIEAMRYKIATYCSIGITIFITLLYFVARVYPKFSLKRNALIFTISMLMLIDGIIWADLWPIEFIIEGIGSISVDLTSLFIGFLIILSLNLIIHGINLISIREESIKINNKLINK